MHHFQVRLLKLPLFHAISLVIEAYHVSGRMLVLAHPWGPGKFSIFSPKHRVSFKLSELFSVQFVLLKHGMKTVQRAWNMLSACYL